MRSAIWPSVPATVDAHVDGAVVGVEAGLEAVVETALELAVAAVAAAPPAAALPVVFDEPHAARPTARSALAHAASCRPGPVRRRRKGRERLMGRS
jgi:hypothetical protein